MIFRSIVAASNFNTKNIFEFLGVEKFIKLFEYL